MGRKRGKKQYLRKGAVTSEETIIVEYQPLTVVYENDKIFFKDALGRDLTPQKSKFKQTYQGENKERTTLYFPKLESSPLTTEAIATEYDVIYGVDTNTKAVKDAWYSVGVCLRGEPEVDGLLKACAFKEFYVYSCINPRKVEQMEPLVWIKVLEKMKNTEDKDKKVLMIVDSLLGNIDAFNDGKELLCGQYKLPKNVTLAYAKADVTDEWSNQLIKCCDQIATKYLDFQIEMT